MRDEGFKVRGDGYQLQECAVMAINFVRARTTYCRALLYLVTHRRTPRMMATVRLGKNIFPKLMGFDFAETSCVLSSRLD